ncbi:Hypothetical predicted protein [Olea europaea subsp. europaea]|uniref:Uncharacterized protein n=1 Tax=Olea europaea subsp. europaea TaxID=158383 RepID=A0A8S0V0C2_OLEEU|nr:Hypothetical predicted protein [Olea europaea subsp. europaea]
MKEECWDTHLEIAVMIALLNERRNRLQETALARWLQRVTKSGKSDLMRMGCEVLPEVETSTSVFRRHCEGKGGDGIGVGEDFDGLDNV